jgi:hypothetical protein
VQTAINAYGKLDILASHVTGALWLADGGVTTAKEAAGADTPFWLRSEPKGELRLDHSREGLENKETKT